MVSERPDRLSSNLGEIRSECIIIGAPGAADIIGIHVNHNSGDWKGCCGMIAGRSHMLGLLKDYGAFFALASAFHAAPPRASEFFEPGETFYAG
jgi:hypothetical protein